MDILRFETRYGQVVGPILQPAARRHGVRLGEPDIHVEGRIFLAITVEKLLNTRRNIHGANRGVWKSVLGMLIAEIFRIDGFVLKAEEMGIVTEPVHVHRQRLEPIVHFPTQVCLADCTVVDGIKSRHAAAPARCTIRGGREKLIESDAFTCQSVNVWRLDATSVTAEMPSDVVAVDNHNVGTISRRTGHRKYLSTNMM